MKIDQNVKILSDFELSNIEFYSQSQQPVICKLHCSIVAEHNSSNISLNAPLILERNSAKHSEFYFSAGNKFKCLSNSNGIYLKNESLHGATIHIEAGDIEFDTATCSISTDTDGSAS